MLGKSLQTRNRPETLFVFMGMRGNAVQDIPVFCGPGMTCFLVRLPSASSIFAEISDPLDR